MYLNTWEDKFFIGELKDLKENWSRGLRTFKISHLTTTELARNQSWKLEKSKNFWKCNHSFLKTPCSKAEITTGIRKYFEDNNEHKTYQNL